MKKKKKGIKKGTKMFYLGTSDSGTMVGFTKDYFGEEGSLLPLVIREVEVLEFDFLRQKYNASRSDADGHIEYFLVEPHCLFETKEEALESAVCDISGSLKHLDWRNKKLRENVEDIYKENVVLRHDNKELYSKVEGLEDAVGTFARVDKERIRLEKRSFFWIKLMLWFWAGLLFFRMFFLLGYVAG